MPYLTLRERIRLADEVIAAIQVRLKLNRVERKELERMLSVQLMERTALRGRLARYNRTRAVWDETLEMPA